jgi:hypothetical protein
LEARKSETEKGEAQAVTGAEKENSGPAANTPESTPDLAAESPAMESPEDRESPEDTTPEQEAAQETQQRLEELLEAYQETLIEVEDLPAVVWVPWGRKGLGSYFKVPYLRWFLRYFVTYHISRSLSALDRRLHAIAALADDPNTNWKNRETVKLYLRSLPSPPYRVLIFTAVLTALVVALPLQSFGNVFYVLDLVGALLRFDVGYVGKALSDNQVGPTIRSLIVLLIGLTVVAAVLTSPFGLKRILFNLHPWTNESFDSTAARDHGYRVEGLYALEERVFKQAGVRRPMEGRWDLMFQTLLLLLLLIFGLLMTVLTLAFYLDWNITLNLDTGGSGNVHFYAPEVSPVYYALITVLILTAFTQLLRRLVAAWKNRSRHARG